MVNAVLVSDTNIIRLKYFPCSFVFASAQNLYPRKLWFTTAQSTTRRKISAQIFLLYIVFMSPHTVVDILPSLADVAFPAT